jgi:MtfA peptidase
MFGFKRRRRVRVRQRAFPDAWEAILKGNVPAYGRLDRKDQAELRGHVLVFLNEKKFEGCGGLEMTDEVRVTIAAQACMLLLRREASYYPQMKTILVYPSRYFSVASQHIGGGVVVEKAQTRLGESWHRGPVVLSWDDVRHGAIDPDDGRNVTLHEFAHQLDSEFGETDGAPALPRASMYTPWARILQREYDKLRDELERHRKPFIDAYGATNPAEFFAVITEAFFEQPRQLKRKHPALYDQLSQFYRQDPAGWG